MTEPMVGCPGCGYLVPWTADWCPRCEATLSAAEMRAAWEATIHGTPKTRR